MKTIRQTLSEMTLYDASMWLGINGHLFAVSKKEINRIKADAVREAAEQSRTTHYAGNERACSYPDLLIYANKLEQQYD